MYTCCTITIHAELIKYSWVVESGIKINENVSEAFVKIIKLWDWSSSNTFSIYESLDTMKKCFKFGDSKLKLQII